jgi:hypothetical protein
MNVIRYNLIVRSWMVVLGTMLLLLCLPISTMAWSTMMKSPQSAGYHHQLAVSMFYRTSSSSSSSSPPPSSSLSCPVASSTIFSPLVLLPYGRWCRHLHSSTQSSSTVSDTIVDLKELQTLFDTYQEDNGCIRKENVLRVPFIAQLLVCTTV